VLVPDEPVQPEVLDRPAEPAPDGADGAEARETITQPSKLIRIASMVRAMLDEVRRAPLDDAGRRRLREIHEKSMTELSDVLSDDLRDELAEVAMPFGSEAPSDSELRIAQAQLVGWLEGLFHGIQASIVTQQMAAQQQFEEMRRRALNPAAPQRPEAGGTYL
jgi:hypothetical protein